MEFVKTISKMGTRFVITIPKDYVKLIEKEGLTDEVRITIEKI